MMAAEHSQIHFGRTVLPYQVRRSPRRATVSIAIDPAAGVLVTAPLATSMERLDRVVHSKATWIVKHLGRRPMAAMPDREFITCETSRRRRSGSSTHWWPKSAAPARCTCAAWSLATSGRWRSRTPRTSPWSGPVWQTSTPGRSSS